MSHLKLFTCNLVYRRVVIWSQSYSLCLSMIFTQLFCVVRDWCTLMKLKYLTLLTALMDSIYFVLTFAVFITGVVTFFVCLSRHFLHLSVTLLFSFVCHTTFFFCFSVTLLLLFVCHITFFICLSDQYFNLYVTPLFLFFCHTTFLICLWHHFFFVFLSHYLFYLSVTPLFSFVFKITTLKVAVV